MNSIMNKNYSITNKLGLSKINTHENKLKYFETNIDKNGKTCGKSEEIAVKINDDQNFVEDRKFVEMLVNFQKKAETIIKPKVLTRLMKIRINLIAQEDGQSEFKIISSTIVKFEATKPHLTIMIQIHTCLCLKLNIHEYLYLDDLVIFSDKHRFSLKEKIGEFDENIVYYAVVNNDAAQAIRDRMNCFK